jgi:hypothetical protein
LQFACFRLIITTAGRVLEEDRVRHMALRPAILACLGLPYSHDE